MNKSLAKSLCIIAGATIALTACGIKLPPTVTPPPVVTPPPPVVTPPPTPNDPAWPKQCDDIWVQELFRHIDDGGLQGCLNQFRAGATSDDVRAEVRKSDEWRQKHQPPPPPPPPSPKPWETITLEQLRAWRGSISTTLAPMPCGPRPGQPTNVMFTAEFGSSCWSADDRAKALAAYSALNFVHWPIGPVESHGYHGRYPDQNWIDNPDGFADLLEQLWRAGKIPVLFLLPDTGYCADGRDIDRECVETRLTPFYTHPRIQALARIVVLAWEPEYRSEDFVWGHQWMARVFPNALRADHEPSGHSAPCRGSQLVEAGGTIKDEGECWKRIAPYIHIYLQQETWTFDGSAVAEGRTPLQQFLYDLWDSGRRLTDGYAGWPTVGAAGRPIDLVAFEYGSYHVTNNPSLAATADAWGDAAISAEPFRDPLTGATVDAARYVVGYGDGGTRAPRPLARTFSFLPSTTHQPRYSFTFAQR